MDEKEKVRQDIEPWEGFAHILCPWCGAEDSFHVKKPTTVLTCRMCRRTIDLPQGTRVTVNCECGFKMKALTNRTDDMFEVPCVNCGNPNSVVYRPDKKRYLPVSYMPKYLQRARSRTKKKK